MKEEFIGQERKRAVYMADEYAGVDDVPVICEQCHKKQITRQGQPCIYCNHWYARYSQEEI